MKLWGTVLFGLLSTVANAQVELEGLTLDDLIVRKVVTASRREEDSTMAPAAIRVITQKEIEDRGYKDLKDVFRDLPGFDVSENVTGEARTLAIARGVLGENKLLVLRDGKRINATTGERLVLGNNMPLFNAKRIEIMYGPGSVLYGADAYSGVVNIITKTLSDLKREAQGRGGLANVSYGMNNVVDTGLMGGGKLAENVDTVWSFRYYMSDGIDPTDYKEFDTYTLDYSQPVKDYELYGRVRMGAGALTFYRQDANEPGGPGTNPALFNFSDSYVWHQVQNKLSFDHTAKGSNWELTSTIGYEDYEIDPESNFNYLPGFGGPAYKYGQNSAFFWEEKLDWKISESTSLISGLLIERVNAFAKGNNLPSPFSRDDQVDDITYPNDPTIPDAYRGQTLQFGMRPYTSSGVYSEVKHKFSDKLLANLGARYDYNTDYHGVFTPRAGIVWKAAQPTTLKLLYGEAYIKPSRYLAYEHWSAGGGTFGYYPNPGLKPEQLRTIQLTAQHQGSKYFAVSLNTYANFIENLIAPTNQGAWNTNANQGAQKSLGGELVLDYRPSQRMQAYINYSYLDAERGDGTHMNKVADHKLNGGFTYNWGKLSLTPSLRYSSGVHYLTGDVNNPVQRGGDFFTADFAARWRNVVKFGDLYLTVRNVMDRQYYTAIPFGEGPEGWLMGQAPQPGRTGELGFSYRF